MKARLFRVVGWLVAALTIATLLWDVLLPDQPGGTEAAQTGFRFGYVMGVFFRTLILGAISLALLRASERVRSPSSKSWEREQLEALVATKQAELPTTAPEPASEYATLSDRELLDVYEHINASAQPERFRALLWVMSQRVAASPFPPPAPSQAPLKG